jgi:hypothetical protein
MKEDVARRWARTGRRSGPGSPEWGANIPHGASSASASAWCVARARPTCWRSPAQSCAREARIGHRGRRALGPPASQSCPGSTSATRRNPAHRTKRRGARLSMLPRQFRRRRAPTARRASPDGPTEPTPPARSTRRRSKGRARAGPQYANAPPGSSPTGRRAWVLGIQARLNTSVPLVPPNPKLFFTATSILRSRASFAQ